MPLAELMLKLADGEKLTPGEREEMHLLTQDMDRIRIQAGAWIDEGGTPALRFPKISDPHFLTSPLDVYTFNLIADTAIPNDTPTYITFDDYTYSVSRAFKVDDADKSHIVTAYPGYSFAVVGNAEWASNATGYRHAFLEGFDSSGVSLGAVQLHTLPATSGVETACPIAFVVNFRQLQNLAYFKIAVRQNSGGDLTLKEVLLSVFLV